MRARALCRGPCDSDLLLVGFEPKAFSNFAVSSTPPSFSSSMSRSYAASTLFLSRTPVALASYLTSSLVGTAPSENVSGLSRMKKLSKRSSRFCAPARVARARFRSRCDAPFSSGGMTHGLVNPDGFCNLPSVQRAPLGVFGGLGEDAKTRAGARPE